MEIKLIENDRAWMINPRTDRNPGFSKMAAVKLLFSKCQRLIGLEVSFQCLNLYFQGQRIQWDQIQEPIAHMQAVFIIF